METKFNSQICSSIEQSRRLLELGLKKETADMTIHIKKDGHWYVTADPFYEWEDDMNTLPCLEEPDAIIPAWSLHRLLCFLPKHIQVYDEVWKFKRNLYLSIDEDFNIRYEENIDEPCFDKIFWAYDIYQNCIDCIEWLIKEGYFPKEYLV